MLEKLKQYWEIFKEWLNDNTTEVTWFLIGFLVSDFLARLVALDFRGIILNIIIIAGLYLTRKIKFR